MADTGHGITSTGYTREIPLGRFLRSFHSDFVAAFPDWEEQLVLQMDEVGNPLSLKLSQRSANRLKNLVLNVLASEDSETVRIEFNGVQEEFSGAFEAVRYIGFIVNEEVVCVSRYINGEFESSWMAEPGSAMRAVNNVDNKPSGCLSFFQPQREESLKITSWSGRMDEMDHFRHD